MKYSDLIKSVKSSELRQSSLLALLEKRIATIQKKIAQKKIMLDKNEDCVERINKISWILTNYDFLMREILEERARLMLRNILETVIMLVLVILLLGKVSLFFGLNFSVLNLFLVIIGSLVGVQRLSQDQELLNKSEEIKKLKNIKEEYNEESIKLILAMLKQERVGLTKVLDYLQTLLAKLEAQKTKIQNNLEQINQKMSAMIEQAERTANLSKTPVELNEDLAHNQIIRTLEV